MLVPRQSTSRREILYCLCLDYCLIVPKQINSRRDVLYLFHLLTYLAQTRVICLLFRDLVSGTSRCSMLALMCPVLGSCHVHYQVACLHIVSVYIPQQCWLELSSGVEEFFSYAASRPRFLRRLSHHVRHGTPTARGSLSAAASCLPGFGASAMVLDRRGVRLCRRGRGPWRPCAIPCPLAGQVFLQGQAL